MARSGNASSGGGRGTPTRGDWGHRYPPLLVMLLPVLLAGLVLPSALNVPLDQPSQTLEFAPVPPQDEDAPPPTSGNVSSTGLGSSSTTTAAPPTGGRVDAPGVPPPPPPVAVEDRPVSKRCVGQPPRQTEDPASPPCVAHFEGDNGGATGAGVSRDEARVIFYFQGGSGQQNCASSRGCETMPAAVVFDLAEPPRDDEYVMVRALRLYQRYFNERFQTYGRFVHFYVAFSSPFPTPEARAADAAQHLADIDPFAIVALAPGNTEVYMEEMAANGVVAIKGFDALASVGLPAEFFQRRPGLMWSLLPSLEERARLTSEFVCQKVLPYGVSFSGNGDDGAPRVLGLLTHESQLRPDLVHLGQRIRAGVEACGGEFAADGTHPCSTVTSTDCLQTGQTAAAQNVAEFAGAQVTTVVVAGGFDYGAHSRAAASIDYQPEWVVAGDGTIDVNFDTSTYYEREVWEHARIVTTYALIPELEERPCAWAAWEVQPGAHPTDVRNAACIVYDDVRMLLTGIQVAGPRLSVTSMDRGYHAIPPVPSGDPRVPGCFFATADYSCIKDAAVMWWDPDGVAPSGRPGCWRMMENGARYVASAWSPGDVETQRDADADRCNGDFFAR